jgi:hypothetical protein
MDGARFLLLNIVLRESFLQIRIMKPNSISTMLISLCFCGIIFGLSGCANLSDSLGYVQKSKFEHELDTLNKQKALDLDRAVENITAAKDEQLSQINFNFQETANELFAAHIALDVETIKSRPVLIADSHVVAARAFAPKPTLDSVLKNQELLKKELDLQKTSNADITARLNDTLAIAGKAQEQLKEKTLAIDLANKEKERIISEDNKKIESAQQGLNQANNQVIAGQNENLKDKAARNKERMWLVGIFTFIGIALGVAAIFSPILKHQFMLGSGAALAIGIGIVLVPQWIITAFACVVFVTLFGWVLYEVLLSHKAASNTYRALQEVKLSDTATFDKLSPTRKANWSQMKPRSPTLIRFLNPPILVN